MGLLIAGLVVFLGVHSIAIIAPQARDGVLRRFGAGAWKAGYALLSLAGFALLIYGFGQARRSALAFQLYQSPDWMRHVTVLLMVPVFPLIFAAYLPGRIKAAAKHPMLAGVKLWALAHLLSNGTLVDVLLFGAFLGWAVMDVISLKRRPQSALGAAGRFNDVLAVALGLALYGVFVGWAHERLIGVAPLG